MPTKTIMLLPILALLMTACAPKPAARIAVANTAGASNSGVNAAADCADAGPTNSSAYTDCVQALSNPNPGMSSNAALMRAQIQQQIAQQQAQLQAQINAAAAGDNSAECVTTRDANNNVVTQCP